MAESTNIKILAKNRKARFNYSVEDNFEAGIELKGTEVKSIRAGNFSFSDAFGQIQDNELWLKSFHITAYDHGNIHNHVPDRDRKLLVHKDEIRRLKRRVDERGYSLIPLMVYLKRGYVKIDIGICKGKRSADKRQSIKERDTKRDADRELSNRY